MVAYDHYFVNPEFTDSTDLKRVLKVHFYI